MLILLFKQPLNLHMIGQPKTPKLLWAIDAHIVNYKPWILNAGIEYVAFNNPEDLVEYNLPNPIRIPYD